MLWKVLIEERYGFLNSQLHYISCMYSLTPPFYFSLRVCVCVCVCVYVNVWACVQESQGERRMGRKTQQTGEEVHGIVC